MKTNTPEFIELSQEIDTLPLSDILSDAIGVSNKLIPVVVLVSSDDLKPAISDKLIAEIFTCSDLHDFLRCGCNQHSCVIVVGNNRHECSTKELKTLLLSRMAEIPHLVIAREGKKDEEILKEIEESCSQIKKLDSLQNSINSTARSIVDRNNKSLTRANPMDESIRLSKFKYSQKLIEKKIQQIIDERPELFLKDAIKQIRKPD